MSQSHFENTPSEFSPRNWWRISKRVYQSVQNDNVSLISAGVAFYFLLAIFPLLAALISLYGLFVDKQTLSEHLALLIGVVPQQSHEIVKTQVESLLNTKQSALGMGFVFSFLLTLYSGGKGSVALITACNISYQEKNHRSFLAKLVVRVALTFSTVVMMLSMVILVAGLPLMLATFAPSLQSQFSWLTWPFLLLLFHFSLAALYRFAPHRVDAKWRWVTPGALCATFFWLFGSYLFNLYITHFANYNQTYGSMGGVVILLLWFYLTAFTVLLGAQINAAAELQTFQDTTKGEEKPKGKRGAYVANHGPEEN